MRHPIEMIVAPLRGVSEQRVRRIAAELKGRDGESWAIGEALERLLLVLATVEAGEGGPSGVDMKLPE